MYVIISILQIPTARLLHYTLHILQYKTRSCMRALTSLLSHLMEVRPNSVPDTPDRIGLNMPGTVVDSSVSGGQRSVDIGPDTDRESSIERLITKRTQRLKDDRENLKDHLHRYINLRSIQK